MVTTEKRKKALAEYLGIDIEDVDDTNYYDGLGFMTKDDGDYLVCTYDEAYDLAVEDIKNSMVELGFDCFSESFRDLVADKFVYKKALADVVYDDLYYGYFDDLSEEELKDECEALGVEYEGEDMDKGDLVSAYMDNNDYDYDPVEYFRQFYNEKDLYMFLFDNGYLDEDAIADECISYDGIAHYLARWDGDEIELDNDLYAYRVN